MFILIIRFTILYTNLHKNLFYYFNFYLGSHINLANGNFAYTIREPLGLVCGIGSFNFPFQVIKLVSYITDRQ